MRAIEKLPKKFSEDFQEPKRVEKMSKALTTLVQKDIETDSSMEGIEYEYLRPDSECSFDSNEVKRKPKPLSKEKMEKKLRAMQFMAGLNRSTALYYKELAIKSEKGKETK